MLDVVSEVDPMWDDQKRARFQQLRQRQREGMLQVTDQAELAALERELQAAETSYLTPATERLRQDRVSLETQNRTLENLTLRKDALVRRLRDFLAEALAERNAIDRQLAEVVAGSRNPDADK
jgi:hypothetical protein